MEINQRNGISLLGSYSGLLDAREEALGIFFSPFIGTRPDKFIRAFHKLM